MEWVYTDEVKDHFINPRNVFLDEEKFVYNASGKSGNIKCGDEMAFYLFVDDSTKVIKDCRWKTYGCASAIASTSVLSEKIKGMTIYDAYKITPKEIVDTLKGLPAHKIHCSVLGDDALRVAIDDYCSKNGINIKTQKK
ncbi:MAG: iron-sulfur cluster assembly scaffold protein [Candidatus Omnitrophica bacterium]|nr:iron-sulfur cluster assembly scaffold protein [Candidatus Omnitrophota bacterium]